MPTIGKQNRLFRRADTEGVRPFAICPLPSLRPAVVFLHCARRGDMRGCQIPGLRGAEDAAPYGVLCAIPFHFSARIFLRLPSYTATGGDYHAWMDRLEAPGTAPDPETGGAAVRHAFVPGGDFRKSYAAAAAFSAPGGENSASGRRAGGGLAGQSAGVSTPGPCTGGDGALAPGCAAGPAGAGLPAKALVR